MSDRTMEALPLSRFCPILWGLLLEMPILNKCTLHRHSPVVSERARTAYPFNTAVLWNHHRHGVQAYLLMHCVHHLSR
jgi:hypothetical protein